MKGPSSRTPSKLSESLHHQLNMYALAASVAGGALAISPPASAKIIYTPTHAVIPPNGTVSFDLNHDGIADFKIRNVLGTHYASATFNSGMFVEGLGAGIAGMTISRGSKWGKSYDAYALPKGARIGPKQPVIGGGVMANTAYNGYHLGFWFNVNQAYLGIRFAINGATHYSWARVEVTHKFAPAWRVVVTGYAYETVPNKPIIAGETKGPDILAEPATLGRLALGRK